MSDGGPPVGCQHATGLFEGRGSTDRWRSRCAVPVHPQALIQVTPLIDVLLVLLVLGVLAWAGHRASGPGAQSAVSTAESIQGLTLPLQGPVQQDPVSPGDAPAFMIGLGLHDQLSWQGVPVTRDMLLLRLREALEQQPQADVRLAVDQAVPYADLMPWLSWLQSQHVTRLTLLGRSSAAVAAPGKP